MAGETESKKTYQMRSMSSDIDAVQKGEEPKDIPVEISRTLPSSDTGEEEQAIPGKVLPATGSTDGLEELSQKTSGEVFEPINKQAPISYTPPKAPEAPPKIQKLQESDLQPKEGEKTPLRDNLPETEGNVLITNQKSKKGGKFSFKLPKLFGRKKKAKKINEDPLAPPPEIASLKEKKPKLPPKPLKNPEATPAPKGSYKKIVILSLISLTILIFIVGEIWWFFIRPKEQGVPPLNEPDSNVSSLPIEGPAQPPEEEETPPPGIVETPEIPPDLLAYNQVEVIELGDLEVSSLTNAINSTINRYTAENLLVRIALIAPSPEGTKVVDLTSLISSLKINIPQDILSKLTGEYNLFILTKLTADEKICENENVTQDDCAGYRLGIALKTSGDIRPELKDWEPTMAQDLREFILADVAVKSGPFLDNIYKGTAIRYRNFPAKTMTIDYSTPGDTFLITTSRASMYRAIDSLK